MITKSDILKYFTKNHSDIFYEMKNCDHGDKENQNPYHLEGSVWNHTEMVMEQLENKDVNSMIASLLHDVGKIYTRQKIDDRIWFKQHQSRSTFESIDILDDMEKYFDYDNINKIDILNIINLHHIFFNLSKEKSIDESVEILIEKLSGFGYDFFSKLKNVCIADIRGRKSKYNKSDVEEIIFKTNSKLYDFLDKKQYIEKDKKSPHVIFTIGIPYSGKTTFIENCLNDDYTIISRDKLITNIYPHIPYHESFQKVNHEEIDIQLQKNLVETVRNRKDFVVDMTNLSRKSRRRKLSYIPNKYKKTAIVHYIGKKELEKRHENRNDKIINIEVINKMINSFNVPLFDEFDEIRFIISFDMGGKVNESEDW